MKLSIITINYNNKAGLEKTISSVMSQTWRDFEWILIDGGSTDGSKEVIENLAKNPDANISYWCSEPDKGIYNAMNKGIAHAKGEYLQFLNSGDWLYAEDTLRNVLPLLSDDDVVYGDLCVVFPNYRDTRYYPEELTLHYLLYGAIGHASSFIKASLFKEKGYNEDFKIISDWYAFIEWISEGKKFRHINLVISNFDATGISSTNDELDGKERIIVYTQFFNETLKNKDISTAKEILQCVADRYEGITVGSIIHIGFPNWILFSPIIIKSYMAVHWHSLKVRIYRRYKCK